MPGIEILKTALKQEEVTFNLGGGDLEEAFERYFEAVDRRTRLRVKVIVSQESRSKSTVACALERSKEEET